MSEFVVRLRDLYKQEFITKSYIDSLKAREKITQEQYDYITAE